MAGLNASSPVVARVVGDNVEHISRRVFAKQSALGAAQNFDAGHIEKVWRPSILSPQRDAIDDNANRPLDSRGEIVGVDAANGTTCAAWIAAALKGEVGGGGLQLGYFGDVAVRQRSPLRTATDTVTSCKDWVRFCAVTMMTW